MVNDDEGFSELITAIAHFCERERRSAKGKPVDSEAAVSLRYWIETLLPDLSREFPNAPNTIYARYAISFAVRGLAMDVFDGIWEDYYKRGITVSELSKRVGYSTKSARSYTRKFPEMVATQLWDEQVELTPSVLQIDPGTIEQRAKRKLKEHYGTSPKQTDVLFEFSRSEQNITRRVIAKRLFIELSTLSSHIKRVLKRTDSSTMNQAANKAKTLLEASFGNEWREYYSRKIVEQQSEEGENNA